LQFINCKIFQAFIPDQLPDDFLRITLDRNQVAGQQRYQHQQQQQQQHPQQIVMDNAYGLPFGYPVAQPLAARGRLLIHLLEAKLNKNYGFINKMDLYVKINVNGKILQTETDYGAGKNPKWNKAIACFIPHGVDSFILEIFDERTLSSDEQIAMIHYVFPEELFLGTPIEEWFPLSGKLGEQKEGHIHLRLQFTVGFFFLNI
jgi:toll-interacting protein